MRKHLLALGLWLCAAIGVKAQETVLVPINGETGMQEGHYPRVSFGPEIGLQFSSWRAQNNGYKINSSTQPGLRAGAVLDIAVDEAVSIQMAGLFSRKAYEVDQILERTIGKMQYTEQHHSYATVNYVEIPVTIQYRFTVANMEGWFVGAGPYVAVAFGGNVYSKTERYSEGTGLLVEASDIKRDILIGKDRGDDVKATDIGLNLNAGYRLSQGMFVRAHTGMGLTNLASPKNEINALRNFSFGLTLGYLL